MTVRRYDVRWSVDVELEHDDEAGTTRLVGISDSDHFEFTADASHGFGFHVWGPTEDHPEWTEWLPETDLTFNLSRRARRHLARLLAAGRTALLSTPTTQGTHQP